VVCAPGRAERSSRIRVRCLVSRRVFAADAPLDEPRSPSFSGDRDGTPRRVGDRTAAGKRDRWDHAAVSAPVSAGDSRCSAARTGLRRVGRCYDILLRSCEAVCTGSDREDA
jgi:hypothetical protein